MALNFPSSPTVGQVYYDETSGFYYEWDGTVWKSYSPSSTSQIKVLDDISSSFDDVTTTFALTSSSVALTPVNAQSLIINLGGVIQDPSNDYSVSGSNIEFTTPPSSGLTFSGVSLGPAINLTLTDITSTDDTTTNSEFYPVFVDGTSATSPTISTPKLTFNPSTGILSVDKSVVGSAVTIDNSGLNVTGITTLSNVVVGGATTELIVEGDARITGILTIGTTSITLDGSNNNVTVGTAVTIIGSTGTVQATTFVGDGSGLSGAGATLDDDVTTNSDMYPVFSSATTGSLSTAKVSSTKLTYNPSTGKLTSTIVNSSSDENLKKDITTIENALDKVKQLRGVDFTWKETEQKGKGVIAQELQKVFPELVSEETDGNLSVNYTGLIAVLIEAIKEISN